MSHRKDSRTGKARVSVIHGAAAALLLATLLATCASAQQDAETPAIPGFVEVRDVYLPAEPYIEGQPRATGLQLPFPPMPSVDTNPITPEKVELGRLLYFDPILSGDNTISCAHCHHPDYGLSDGRKTSMGLGGTGVGPERSGGDVLARGAPTIWNAAYSKWQFWDGRAKDLEEQAAGPITDAHEMAEEPERLVGELKEIPKYVKLFRHAFGGNADEAVTFDNVTRAVATFERTLLSFNSRFDQFAAGETGALSAEERRGMSLFRSLKTRCFECHNFPNFADDTFRVIGVPDEGERDLGRAGVPDQGPVGAFKVPTLRNVELNAPYMHNGRFATLEEVIEFYSKGGGRDPEIGLDDIDDKIGKFEITEQETADLVAFLKSLTDTSLLPEAPNKVPSGLPVVEVKSKPTGAPATVASAAAQARRIPRSVVSRPPTAVAPAVAPPRTAARPSVASRRPTAARPSSLTARSLPPRVATRVPTPRSLLPSSAPRAGAWRNWTRGASTSATFTVRPGQSIQAAVDRCRPGDRVEVLPGVYDETISVDRAGITLVGKSANGRRPVLDGGGKRSDAVQASGDGFTIEGFVIRRYVGNGVVANKARDVVFRDMVIDDTGLYGLYAVECQGVLIENCVASGINDAALYVGQSRDIVVRDNEVFNNVAGIEIENSVGALVANNSTHHNTTGILVFVLPNNPSKVGSHARVIGNRVWANNHANFGKPGTIVSRLPYGVGILVMGADHTVVTENLLAENDSYGAVVVNLAAAGVSLDHELDVEPNSDYTVLAANTYRENGRRPADLFTETLGAPGGDLFWDGTGSGNTWRETPPLVTFPEGLIAGGSARIRKLSPESISTGETR